MIREFSAIAEHHGVDGTCTPSSVLHYDESAPARDRRPRAAHARLSQRGGAGAWARGAVRPPRSVAVTTSAPSAARASAANRPRTRQPTVADAPPGATPRGDDYARCSLAATCLHVEDPVRRQVDKEQEMRRTRRHRSRHRAVGGGQQSAPAQGVRFPGGVGPQHAGAREVGIEREIG
jgi:hypothetical protein